MNRVRYATNAVLILLILVGTLQAADYHVSKSGDNGNIGSQTEPFKTIFKAAESAQPGDTITVHEGVYRERVNPPRGGSSDKKRIVYQAAPGEKVVIKGSEQIADWKKVEEDVWKVVLPNSFFGDFNPYGDLIHGDWYQARQPYHTGAVYVNGHWLKEAPRKSVLTGANGGDESDFELMNVESLRIPGGANIHAADASSKSEGVAVQDLANDKSCVGPLKHGDWLAFSGVDFGQKGSKSIALSTGSPVGGGLVEIHLDSPEGELLGRLDAGLTAEWTHFQSFSSTFNRKLSGKQTIILVFKARPVTPVAGKDAGYWFAEVDEKETTIWAQFKGVDPNKELVEINVRKTVFYSKEPGRNYITVRGFTLEQAATPWSPPTAEQVGLIGTHWSKGWIIEENTIQYSACSGVTLGKHGDEFDNTYNYFRTIEKGLECGWSRKNIGSHLVRNNHILHCGQGGIIGSLGCAFSTITGNEIHEIRQHHDYGGCETAGIKLHGAVDAIISNNHIYRCAHWGGIWLDWMGQGARITGNLLHDNSNDMMFEMNHGPMLIDNNILLSGNSVLDASGGGAYVHNLIRGSQNIWAELSHRKTPAFKPHSTDVIDDPHPANEFGALDGRIARFADPVENTEQDAVYQTVRYGAAGYRLDVPNGTYRVTLKFNEPFYDAPGQRRFGATVQGESVVEQLDLEAKAGKNQAVDVVAEHVQVKDGVLNIGFVRDRGLPCIAGIEVVGTRSSDEPYALRINCGGPAREGFLEDSVVVTDKTVKELFGFTVDQNDDRFFNNLYLTKKALSTYDEHHFRITADGNVFLAGAQPSKREKNAFVAEDFDLGIKLVESADGWWLEMNIDSAWQAKRKRPLVTSKLLGRVTVPDAPFGNRDGTPYRIDADYFGEKRDENNPAPGALRAALSGKVSVKVWPRK
ncbi:MAG: malectin domain-containing carbohydrate-binding protein [Kiritimatiellae bacterium]|jgi:alpha-N-arabinofuranosidase|nr:malectin domain-containing carbohydrate-binding protein [Kiritimatiellia bacterium]